MSSNAPSPVPHLSKSKLQERLDECYERGKHLMRLHRNHDYAHTMFAECVLHDPANLKYLEALLQNLRAKFPVKKKRRAFFLRRGRRALKQSIDHQELTKVFQLGIDLLKIDPWDSVTLRTLAQACAHFHYNEAELAYLKQALDAKPKDIEVNRHCAMSLARVGQFDQAIACWHRIETIRPGDRESAQMVMQLTEERQKYPGGRPPIATKPRDNAPVVVATQEAGGEPMEVTLSPRQQLEKAITADPYDISNYLELADLLAESEQFQEAEAALLRGIATCGEHTALKNGMSNVQTLRAELELAAAETRRKEEQRRQKLPFRMPWLELVLGLAGLALVAQLFPPVASFTLRLIDFRHWSRTNWFVANITVLLVLVSIRLWPDLSQNREKQRKVRFSRSNK